MMLICPMEPDAADWLRDESRRTGKAEWLAQPKDEDELSSVMRESADRGLPVTVQGARTGVTGGAVPDKGMVISLLRMNRLLGATREGSGATLRVQPGMLLSELRELLAGDAARRAAQDSAPRAALESLGPPGAWRFVPDPTETSASLGGMASCNASGALSFAHGPMRDHVVAARLVLADGDRLTLRRGVDRAEDGRFALRTEGGRLIEGSLPTLCRPAVKNAAGYAVSPDMDLLDLFIGAEGTLGVISELELNLLPAPACSWGILCFLPDDAVALMLVKQMRVLRPRPVALEYFDGNSLDLLRRDRADGADLPELDSAWRAALYVEFEGGEASVEEGAMALCEALETVGAGEDQTWMGADEAGIEKLKAFRHAVPERVNLRIDRSRRDDPRIVKVGTDLSVPDDALSDLLERERADLDADKLPYVIFGHIGDNHLHVNVLSRTWEDVVRGREHYADWARLAVRLGGSVAAEHGIGKLKTGLLELMFGADGVAAMRSIKTVFDPDGRLNAGNLFETH